MNGRPLWLAALGLLCLSACDKPESSAQPAEKQTVEATKTVSAAVGTDTVLMKKNDLINKNTSKPVIDKKQLEQLASRYANRALSVVDASDEITLDGASAISLTFSVPLDPEQNFADLVQITDEDKGVVDGAWELTANLMELRLRHVEPNRKLIITVTDNLEAIMHESLKKEEQFRITTRDLQPSVGFASKGSLLPATLSAGLPVVALNVEQVDVDFFRVKDDKVASFANRWGSNSSLNSEGSPHKSAIA